MKVVLDGRIYVQKKDLDFLVYKRDDVPSNIMLKIFRPGQNCIDGSNKYDFIEFEEEADVQYFSKINWLLDYAVVKDLSADEIVGLRSSYAEERDILVKVYNAMSDSEKLKNVRLYEDIEALNYKAQALTSFLWYRQGDIEMSFPEGLEKKQTQKTLGTIDGQKI